MSPLGTNPPGTGRPGPAGWLARVEGSIIPGRKILVTADLHYNIPRSRKGAQRIGHISVTNIGSTYRDKRLDVLELPAMAEK